MPDYEAKFKHIVKLASDMRLAQIQFYKTGHGIERMRRLQAEFDKIIRDANLGKNKSTKELF